MNEKIKILIVHPEKEYLEVGKWIDSYKITKIIQDEEAGQMAMVPVYLVYCVHHSSEFLFRKYQGSVCSVEYFRSDEQ